jgi:hypothetical protein
VVFLLASAWAVVSAAFLLYDSLPGALSKKLPEFGILAWLLATYARGLGGSFLCADLIVEWFRRLNISGGSWTEAKHFGLVARVCIVTLLGLLTFYWIAFKAMLEPAYPGM